MISKRGPVRIVLKKDAPWIREILFLLHTGDACAFECGVMTIYIVALEKVDVM